MKTAAVLLAGTMFLSGAAGFARAADDSARALYIPGSYQKINLPMVEKNFRACLTEGADMVKESVLGHIIWLRLMRTDVSLDGLRDEIDRLATEGDTPSLRYRASLTSAVLDSPNLFAGLSDRNFETGNDLFVGVARTAQVTLLGAR